MTTNTEENNPFLTLSSDEDFAIVEEEPLAQNKNIDIFSLFNFLNDPIQLAAKLRYYNILKSTVYCSSRGCRREMRAEKHNNADGYIWRCGTCRKTRTIRAGSYFERSKLPLKKLVLLAYCWAYDIPQHAQAKLCGVSYRVSIQWNVYFRDVTTEWLKQNPIKLGGKGVICQIGLFIILILFLAFI